MANTNVRIKIINVIPPTMLGDSTIILNIGDSYVVTPSDLMNSMPPYQQPQNFDIGSIRILGTLDNYLNILDNDTQNSGIAELTNDGLPIGYTANNFTTIENDLILQNDFYTGALKIDAISTGTTNFYYTATAWDGQNTESVFDPANIGKVTIIVNNPNNQPPNNLDDSNTNCVLGSYKILDMSHFSVNYSDPENDPIGQVRIDGVNSGYLTLNFTQVTNYPLFVTPQQINLGQLIYHHNPNAQIGNTDVIMFTVSDTGSGQFY